MTMEEANGWKRNAATDIPSSRVSPGAGEGKGVIWGGELSTGETLVLATLFSWVAKVNEEMRVMSKTATYQL